MKIVARALIAILIVGVGAAAAQLMDTDTEALDREVAKAKQIYRADPTGANLAAVEAAVAAYEAAQPRVIVPTRAINTESEPNDTSFSADTVVLNMDRGTGDIFPPLDRDWWVAAGAAVGDLLFVLLDSVPGLGGTPPGTSTDTEISVFETDGTTLIEFDDDSGDGVGSAVADIVPTAGSIFVEVNEFGDDHRVEPYNIFIAAVPPGMTGAESEPNDTSGTANNLSPNVQTGDLGDATADFFQFAAMAGDRIGIVVNNDPDANATNTDAELTLFDTDGSTVLASEAPFSVTSQNAVAATAVNTGTHFVSVTDGGGADTDYSLVIFVIDSPVPVELEKFDIE